MHAIPEEIKEVYRYYSAMSADVDREHGLGGHLLFAGSLSDEAVRRVRAANIAGAASLALSSDNAVLRRAMREGVVDFAVTTLDEALRILKNEIRKRQPVSVGIHGELAAIESEMRERGVKPDLGYNEILHPFAGEDWLAISLPAGDTAFAGQLEAAVMDALPVGDVLNRRWFRQSSRYLGREHRRLRTLCVDATLAEVLSPLFNVTGSG